MIGFVVAGLMLLFVCLAGVAAWSWFELLKSPPLTANGAIDYSIMGQRGDFFGGHLASVVGSLTLALAIVLGYFQTVESTRANLRSHFLEGLNLVFAALDFEKPEMDPTESKSMKRFRKIFYVPHATMRVVDYYSRLSLELDDAEYYLIVATMISGDIKKTIRSYSDQKSQTYVYAQKAWKRIQELRMDTEIERKADEEPEA
jgi:hypothetical protein